MPTHIANGVSTPCPCQQGQGCRICELIDPASPHYREEYHRLYHPEEFGLTPGTIVTVVQALTDPAPIPSTWPLAGDLVAAMTKRVGIDRLTNWVAEELGGGDCGCESRRQKLNELDAKFRKFLGW